MAPWRAAVRPSARRRLMPDRGAALLRVGVGVGAVQACAIPAAASTSIAGLWLAAELVVAPGVFFPSFLYNVMIDP